MERRAQTSRHLGLGRLPGIHEAVFGIHGAIIRCVGRVRVVNFVLFRMDWLAVRQQNGNLQHVDRLAREKGAMGCGGLGFVIMFDIVVQ